MSLPTVQEITNLYLYGQETTPNSEELVDEQLIRPDLDLEYKEINAVEYMNVDAGRFALGSMSALVKKFFSFVGDIPGMEPGVEYTKKEMAKFLNLSKYGINVQQYSYDDGHDDFGERVYIWNSTAFKLNENVRFVVDSDGTRHIENFSVVPRFDFSGNNLNKENFDLESSDFKTFLANQLLQEKIDTSEIGRKIIFDFINVDTIQGTSYTLEHYQNDLIKEENWYQGDLVLDTVKIIQAMLVGNSIELIKDIFYDTPLGIKIYNSIEGIWEQLWDDGVTQFLDPENRPILYGTESNDDLNSSINIFSPLSDYESNGVVIIGGVRIMIISRVVYIMMTCMVMIILIICMDLLELIV